MRHSACKRARQMIVRDWDQRISLDDGFQLEEHLAVCASCAELAAQHAELDEAFARLPEPPTMRIDLDVAVAGVREQLSSAEASQAAGRSSPRLFRRPLTRFAIGTLAAAATVLLLLRQIGVPGRGQAPLDRSGTDAETVAPTSTAGEHEPRFVADSALVAVPVPPTADELARLLEARASFRTELLDVADALTEPEGIERLELATRELRAAQWPLRSIAEGLLEDPEVAPAAVRYLGWRGNRRSATLLARMLDEPALANDVVIALAQLGPDGFPGLGRALENEATHAPALEALVRGGAVLELERAMRTRRTRAPEMRAELVRGLALAGGLAALLELAVDGHVSEAEWLAGLDAVSDPATELRMLAGRDERGPRAVLLLRGIGHGRVAALLPWVERQTVERKRADDALRTLSAVGGIEGARSWLRLAIADRVDTAALDLAAVNLALEGRDELKPLVVEVADGADRRAAEELLALLALAPPVSAGPALVAYASMPSFPDDMRQWAVLSALERGDAAELEGLASLFTELDASDRLLAAAVLQALYALGGAGAVRDATSGLDRRVHDELVGLFVDREDHLRGRHSGRAVTLLELARRVGPALPDFRSRGTQP